jgi:hypothetical protein
MRRLLVPVLAASFVSLSIVPQGSFGAPTQVSAAVSMCFGRTPTIVGTNGADVLIGTSGADVIVGQAGNDHIEGGGGGDYICGNAGDDVLFGDGGSDGLNGGADSDIVLGGGSADVVAGGSGMDILLGQQGNDTYNGGGGLDLAGFLASAGPVHADIREKFASGEGSDSIHYVEGLIGSEHGDSLYGSAALNVFVGAGGNDELHGRAGGDFVFYALAPGGVSVDLEADTANGEGTDTIVSIENVMGSPFDDSIWGDAGPNYLDGAEGVDTIDGRSGGDACIGESTTNCADDVPTSDGPPDNVTAAASLLGADAGPVPTKTAPPPSEDSNHSTAAIASTAGSLACPPGWWNAIMSMPTITGYGYYAYRTNHPFTGASDWTYSPWFYWDADGWRVYFLEQWWWSTGMVQLQGGTQLPVEGWYYSHTYGQWYKVGECITTGVHLIPGMTMVYNP